ncbi:MAG: phosphoserine phosphatase SerB [Roseomonas sp.]|nr:phosphoserine phosphatase SerB [Roseomonas sp.]MCA3429360.1 phosphoserine phosphatase SerB [Roseomonas sp.]MCA3435005.1 phosphoserine phosphatase SerB [Roseomonas sp.]
MEKVLTLIAPRGALAPEYQAKVAAALRDAGAELGAVAPLAAQEAADIPFAGLPLEIADRTARSVLEGSPVDAIAQDAAGRRKRLLIADMDSTMVTSETLDELAGEAGLKEEISAITRRAMNGELDFEGALRERVGMLKGLALEALERTWASTALMPGAEELVATMRAHGARCALVSGGFTFFTGRVAERLGFHEHYSNTLLHEGGRLTGQVGKPILGRNAKLVTLKRLAAEEGIDLAASLAVGDGANDLDMLGAAGLGVAFKAKPVVAAAARARVDHADLRALLFAQGYREEAFRRVV